MSGEIYFFGLLGNLLIWTVVVRLFIYFLDKMSNTWLKKSLKLLGWIIFIASMLSSYVYFDAIDWRLKWTHDNFKLDYYQTEIDCERKLIFFSK